MTTTYTSWLRAWIAFTSQCQNGKNELTEADIQFYDSD